MTVTAERTALPAVGEGIETVEQMLALPVGTVIRGGRYNYRREPDGYFRCEETDSQQRASGMSLGGYNIIVSYPFQEGDEVFTVETLSALPVGSIVRGRGGHNYTRTATGYRTRGGTDLTFEDMVPRMCVVHSVNETRAESITSFTLEGVEDETVVTNTETLDRYKQRLRTICYGHAQRSGISTDPLTRAFIVLGVPDPEPCPGMALSRTDSRLLMRVPDGSILTVTQDPKNPAYEVYGKQHGGLALLLGDGAASNDGLLYLHTVPGVEPPDWTTRPATETDLEVIQAFKDRVKEVGAKAKQENSWCGVYEAALAQAGIRTDPDAPGSDALLSAEQVAELPEGTILRYQTAEHSVLYLRHDQSVNPAKTVRIGGTLPGAFARQGMQVVRQATEPVAIRIASHAEMDGMPVGTKIGDRPLRRRNSQYWTRREDGRWETDSGYTYNSNQFGIGEMFYMVIP